MVCCNLLCVDLLDLFEWMFDSGFLVYLGMECIWFGFFCDKLV